MVLSGGETGVRGGRGDDRRLPVGPSNALSLEPGRFAATRSIFRQPRVCPRATRSAARSGFASACQRLALPQERTRSERAKHDRRCAKRTRPRAKTTSARTKLFRLCAERLCACKEKFCRCKRKCLSCTQGLCRAAKKSCRDRIHFACVTRKSCHRTKKSFRCTREFCPGRSFSHRTQLVREGGRVARARELSC